MCFRSQTVRTMVVLVAVVAFSTLLGTANLRAQDAGADTVGAWFGKVFVAPAVGFPFQATFNRDGTWTGSDARGFGQIPLDFPFTATGGPFSGSWVKVAPRKYQWTGTQILIDPTLGYFVLVARGSHQVGPGDFDHATNGTAGAKIFPCGPTAFGCPDADAILSDTSDFVPTFTYSLSRVRPK